MVSKSTQQNWETNTTFLFAVTHTEVKKARSKSRWTERVGGTTAPDGKTRKRRQVNTRELEYTHTKNEFEKV